MLQVCLIRCSIMHVCFNTGSGELLVVYKLHYEPSSRIVTELAVQTLLQLISLESQGPVRKVYCHYRSVAFGTCPNCYKALTSRYFQKGEIYTRFVDSFDFDASSVCIPDIYKGLAQPPYRRLNDVGDGNATNMIVI